MKKLKHKFNKWKFDRKMFVFVSLALSISVGLIMIVSIVSSVLSITKQSQKLVEEKVQAMVANTEGNFEQYEGIFWALTMDSAIQSYLQEENKYAYLTSAQKTLENACNMWGNMNFIGIISEDGEKSCIKGNYVPNSQISIHTQILEELNSSMKMSRKITSMRSMTYNTTFSKTGKYSLMLYQPIFSNTRLDQYIGLACININDSNLNQLLSKNDERLDMNNYFLYGDGTIISCGNKDEIGNKMDVSYMEGERGYKWKNGYLYTYQKLKKWNYLYVTNISIYELCKDSILSLMLSIIVMLVLLFFIYGIANKIIKAAYRPWQSVAETMGEVAKGNLEARLNEKDTDTDMERITHGFNVMMDTILKLMKEVEEEQYQMSQIRFEALQSQIQPHFLYNTLDCIHWQAVIDGNKEISELVKTLASYYRTCLSRGREIISLEEELEHTRNYLYIQQMRYGEVLTYEIEEQMELDAVKIPKLTLQPLVENSIYHGIKVKDGKTGHISIKIRKNMNDVIIIVKDSGTGMTEEQICNMNRFISQYDETMGYGVRNVNRRIELLFGESYGLYYNSNDEGGVTVEILIPEIFKIENGENKYV